MSALQAEKPASKRLSKAVTPSHYDVTIKTDLKALTFEGKVEIDVDINETTDSVILHALTPLKVHQAFATSTALKTENYLEAKSIDIDEKEETAALTLPTALQAGTKAKLGLTFTAPLEPSMAGYYKSTHAPDPSRPEQTENYALTQFEPTAARKAFPCWDEPAVKATFALTMIHRKETTALGNMNAIETVPSDGIVPALFKDTVPASATKMEGKTETTGSADEWVKTTYATTPKMSTYLVAWADGKFESLSSSYVSPLTGKSVPLKIYTTREHIHQAQLALDTKVKILPIYERIFDIAYPLPKLDTLVASDFDAGAMENWGLITGRTSVYLYDDKASGIAAKKTTTSVQSHEVAHQWFGNVVTMEWWDNLWLNEAFATLMGEVIIINELHPEWGVHSEFINDHLGRALELDALRSSHPIEMPCPDSSMVNQIFDAISYSKGASVLKMLANHIGEKTFLHGVSLYLKNHLYGNSRTADLWNGIAKASGLDVAKVMANWTLKTGFPVVTVEETSEGIKLRQNRFLSTGDVKPEEDETLWWVPLEVTTVKDGKPSVDHKAVLENRETTYPIKDVSNAIYKLNSGSAGVYRVSYPPERLAKLGEEAVRENSSFSMDDRIGLIGDAKLLAKAGYGKTSGTLSLISKFAKEREYLVWAEVTGAVSSIANVWWEQGDDVSAALDAVEGKLVAPLAAELGFDSAESDSAAQRELRSTIISAALASKEPNTVAEAQRRFGLFIDQNKDDVIPGDLRRSIFNYCVRYGGEKEWEKMLAVYRNPPTPQHKVASMLALTSGSTPELQQRTFDLLSSDEVKTQDVMYFMAGFARNRKTRRATWEYMKKNFTSMEERFKGNFTLGRIIQYSFDSLTTEEDAKDVEAFFKDKDTSNYIQSLSQGLDAIRSNAGWLSRDGADVRQWLVEHKYL